VPVVTLEGVEDKGSMARGGEATNLRIQGFR
jgi:hypothetical protein